MGPPSKVAGATAVILIFIAFVGVVALSGWFSTTLQLESSRSEGVYASAEEGMRALINHHYVGITSVEILSAGPNSFSGKQPHVWYVIAEVRALRRADGSELGHNGCDAPGSFFLQARDGWVYVSEGSFPEIVGLWMRVFGVAGPGLTTPSTKWPASHSTRICQSA